MTDRDLFIDALGHSDPTERSAWLDRACAGDIYRRQRVELLLRAHEDARRFLDPPHGTAAFAGEPAPAATADIHAFLAPSDLPGLLGMLGYYEVSEVVGRGGMGVVLKAFDPKLHRLVALKLMAPHLAANGTARKRFEREAKAVAAVRNEHVVAIHAVYPDGPTPYLVMEYVVGNSLQDRIDRRGPGEVKEVLRIGMQVARGLAAAHAQGLVHRDVKPANILLENGVERVKITDFGLARAAADANLTQSGVITGTPNYMSPEQACGTPVDARSDLFSLGAVMYALCTGHPPFRADNPLAILRRVCDDPIRPPREVNSDVPDWLDAIVRKLLAKNPADRFQSATEVADLLGCHLAHLQQPNLAPKPDPLMIAATAVGSEPDRPRLAWPVTFALLALLGLFFQTQKTFWQEYFRPGYYAPLSMLITSALLVALLWWRRKQTDPGWRRISVELAIAAVVLGTSAGLLAAWEAGEHLERLSRASTCHTLGLMASALIMTGFPMVRWATLSNAPLLARATVCLIFVAAWACVGIAYWAVATRHWVFVPSEQAYLSNPAQIGPDAYSAFFKLENCFDVREASIEGGWGGRFRPTRPKKLSKRGADLRTGRSTATMTTTVTPSPLATSKLNSVQRLNSDRF